MRGVLKTISLYNYQELLLFKIIPGLHLIVAIEFWWLNNHLIYLHPADKKAYSSLHKRQVKKY